MTITSGEHDLDLPDGVSQQLLRASRVTNIPLLVVEATDAGPMITWSNRAVADLIGYHEEDLRGSELAILARSPLFPGADAPILPALDPCRATVTEMIADRIDGSKIPLLVAAHPTSELSWVLELRQDTPADDDATTLRFRALLDRAPVAVLSSEAGLHLDIVNARFAALLGAHPSQLLGTGWLERVTDAQLIPALQNVLAGEYVEQEITLPPTITNPSPNRRAILRAAPIAHRNRPTSFVATVEEVTERREFETKLEFQATHDALTGLPNRIYLDTALPRMLTAPSEAGTSTAVIFVDLDNFKLVNDSMGHGAGDRLLVETSLRLARALRRTDVVARFGGDEFVILCPKTRGEDGARIICQRILDAVTKPVHFDDKAIHVSASVGVALADGTTTEPEVVLRHADIAMYMAKEAGKNQFAVFDARVQAAITERLEMISDLRESISAHRIDVAYQPIIDFRTGRPIAVEALSRWNRPGHGPVPAIDFIPAAEEHGLITALGAATLRKACAEFQQWRQDNPEHHKVVLNVNVAARQLADPDFVAVVASALDTSSLPGNVLCLELTESTLVDHALSTDVLERLHELGVTFAIDDFGTGYSSLAYLHQLPVHHLKIDKSFVDDIDAPSSGRTRAIVTSVVMLAKALGMKAVAEGIETTQQLEALRLLGCPAGQGFLFGGAQPTVLGAVTVWEGKRA